MRGEPGRQAVIVYSSPPGGLIPAPELRHHLRSRQPERMVPGAFAHLERLPVTAHGRVRAAPGSLRGGGHGRWSGAAADGRGPHAGATEPR